MKKQTKAVAAKRPRTYKKTDLPRTARAYINAMGGTCYTKENEAVARLIELHEEWRKELKNHYAENIYSLPAAVPAFVRDPEPKKLTLREQFLAWIGVKP